jgi:TfoX/Sxy family transcriptional regulator of competence genes
MTVKWRKPSKHLTDTLASMMPNDPRIEVRQVFGCPCAFVNGNMFAGIHQDSLVIRLGHAECAELIERDAAAMFEPQPGRLMREYVALPTSIISDSGRLQRLIGRSLEYASTLPPKRARTKKRPAKS